MGQAACTVGGQRFINVGPMLKVTYRGGGVYNCRNNLFADMSDIF